MSPLSGLVDRVLVGSPRSTAHKLHAVRFGRLVESLFGLVDLGDDAVDKLGGEWILDRSYVASFVGRALDRAREMAFDSTVLAGDRSAELSVALDVVRADLDRLMAAGVREGEEGRADGEEPEYRLLRAAIQRLALAPAPGASPGAPGASPGASPGAPGLAEVVRDAHELALRSFADLHFRSWGRRAGQGLEGSGFPGPIRVVDAGGGVAASRRGWGSGVSWERVRCDPLRALLEPLAAPDRKPSTPGTAPRALAILDDGRATVAVNWPRGGLLLDARLEDHAPANCVYCALRGEPPGRGDELQSAFAETGFRRLELGAGTTGWVRGRSRVEIRDVLGRVGRGLGALLSEPRGGSPAPRRVGRTPSGEWRA